MLVDVYTLYISEGKHYGTILGNFDGPVFV